MHLIIKSLAGKLSEQERQYLRQRFLWLKEHMGNSAELTIGVKEHITKKSNQAYEVVLHLTKPGLKRPIYARVSGNDFRIAVDRAKEKIERIVVKKKEKGSLRFRIPRIRLRRSK